MKYKRITLKKGKEMPVKAGHPWIFSGGTEKTETKITTGEFVDIFSSEGKYLATGSYHQDNSIRVRILTRNEGTKFDTDFFAQRFRKLETVKRILLPEGTDGFRLVHSDADMMPGLVTDIYGKNIVIQINTAAMESLRPVITEALSGVFKPKAIIERSDMENRKLDHLKPVEPACVYGSSDGKAFFSENRIAMISDMLEGQKTGFFLDQRDARIFVKKASSGKKVLNLFSYTGGFSVSAAAGGAEKVISVDVSERALAVAEEIFLLNSTLLDKNLKKDFIAEDVFDYLSSLKNRGQKENFDIIICDPPAFAKKRESTAEAVKAYIRLNRMCLENMSPGCMLVSSSCSGMIGWGEFSSILKVAAGQAGKDASVIAEFSQAPDHTRKVSFPEGNYLKTAVLLVTA